MARCYICNCTLNFSNESCEHIIPNGIGGRLRSTKILCNQHNNLYSKFDEELCNDLLFFTNFLNPKRDRGKNPQAKFSNDEGLNIIREANGDFYSKPTVKVEKNANGKIKISIKAFFSDTEGGQKAIEKQVNKILLSSIQKTNISEDKLNLELKKISNYLATGGEQIKNPKFNFEISFNKKGNLFFSIAKIVLGFYVENNLEKEYINEFLENYKNNNRNYINQHINYYYPNDFYYSDSIYHTIIIIGDSDNKVLYSLVSLYGILNLFILLNSNYNGKNIYKSYCDDLRNHTSKNFDNDLTLDLNYISNEVLNSKVKQSEIKKATIGFMDFLVNYTIDIDILKTDLNEIFASVYKDRTILSKYKYVDKLKKI